MTHDWIYCGFNPFFYLQPHPPIREWKNYNLLLSVFTPLKKSFLSPYFHIYVYNNSACDKLKKLYGHKWKRILWWYLKSAWKLKHWFIYYNNKDTYILTHFLLYYFYNRNKITSQLCCTLLKNVWLSVINIIIMLIEWLIACWLTLCSQYF
jgi:hypothetical protein